MFIKLHETRNFVFRPNNLNVSHGPKEGTLGGDNEILGDQACLPKYVYNIRPLNYQWKRHLRSSPMLDYRKSEENSKENTFNSFLWPP